MPQDVRTRVSKRLIYAFVGFLAGEAALLLILLHAFSRLTLYDAFSALTLFAVFSLIGWVLVGLPIAVAVPARAVTNMPWPLWVLIGVLSGPVALSLIFPLLFRGFADTGAYWLSILVSTVCAVVYRALLRKSVRSGQGGLQAPAAPQNYDQPDGRISSVRGRTWVWLITAVVLLVGGPVAYLKLFSGIVQHSVRLQKEMTWECAPDQYKTWAPEAQPVRFRFVEDPHYEEGLSGRRLCDQLKASGKEPVMVEFEAWGNRQRGLIGYREIAVDGNPIIDVGGWGSSSLTGSPLGPHPLRRSFQELLALGKSPPHN